MVFKGFDTMLLGAVIKIHTDHKNLTYTSSVNDCIFWQLNHIEWFGSTYQHISGDDNFLADMFSQLHWLLEKRESIIENFSFILDDK
jgi:hypothetical protein